MANYVTRAISELVNVIRGQRVKIGDIFSYKEVLTYIDFADDDLINKRALAAIVSPISDIVVSIPAGSDVPFLVDMTLEEYLNVSALFDPQTELLLDGDFETATKSRVVYDVVVEKDYEDATRANLTQLQIWGYPDDVDPTITQKDLILIIK